jgi:hypothetical protein
VVVVAHVEAEDVLELAAADDQQPVEYERVKRRRDELERAVRGLEAMTAISEP